MEIEAICKRNLDVLASLFTEMFPGSDFDEEMRSCERILLSASEICYLARGSAGYIGFIHVALRFDYVEGVNGSPAAYIEAIYVRPGYRRSGIASMMVQHAEEWAIGKNVHTLASDSEISNTDGIGFHHANGFREVNRVVCFVKKIGKEV